MNNRKRQRECPNPLFLKWLEEWRDEAKQKNSKLQYTYGKAAAALKKYPLPLSCGKDAMILDNIGEMIAQRLDQAMAKHDPSNQEEERYSRNPCPMLESLSVPVPPLLVLDGNDTKKTTPKKKQARKKGTREYIPAYRSGPYALMLTLFRQSQRTNYRGYMTRPELQKEAQPLCDASFTVPDPGSHYTAWSSMSTLIKKGFILKTNNPARYSLTDAGCALAEKLETVTGDSLSPNSSTSSVSDSIQPPLSGSSDFKSKGNFSLAATNVVRNSSHTRPVCVDVEEPADFQKKFTGHHNFTSVQKRKEEVKPKIEEDDTSFIPDFVLRPGTFDVILCVDINETTAGQTNSRKATLVPELKKNGVQFDVRKLQLGDFLWVARERTVPTPGSPCYNHCVCSYCLVVVQSLASCFRDHYDAPAN